MGGTEVTALYYADGVINIPDVSGNIEITITAAVYVPSYTNVLPLALNPDTKSGVWDGIGVSQWRICVLGKTVLWHRCGLLVYRRYRSAAV